MIFSSDELLGLSAISGGGVLPGFPPPQSAPRQATLAMEGLISKGVLDERKQVTEFGVLPVQAVEQYRTADRYVIINHVKASVNSDGALTVFHPVDDQWHLTRMSPLQLMVGLLKAYPWMCGSSREVLPTSWVPMTILQWAEAQESQPGSPLMVRTVSRLGGRSQVLAYSHVENSGFVFVLSEGKGREMPVGQIRTEIADSLGWHPQEGGEDHG